MEQLFCGDVNNEICLPEDGRRQHIAVVSDTDILSGKDSAVNECICSAVSGDYHGDAGRTAGPVSPDDISGWIAEKIVIQTVITVRGFHLSGSERPGTSATQTNGDGHRFFFRVAAANSYGSGRIQNIPGKDVIGAKANGSG